MFALFKCDFWTFTGGSLASWISKKNNKSFNVKQILTNNWVQRVVLKRTIERYLLGSSLDFQISKFELWFEYLSSTDRWVASGRKAIDRGLAFLIYEIINFTLLTEFSELLTIHSFYRKFLVKS